MNNIVQLNEGEIKNQLGEMVRKSVEETLNAMLEEEADQITQAHRYERRTDRRDTRAGHYTPKLVTKAGEVRLRIPKLRKLPFETAIIERYKRREESVEEALIEMYLAGVSIRRVEDISEALWGARVSSGTISNLNQKVYAEIDEWRERELLDEYPYVYLDGIYLKKNWGGTIENVAILVALGVNSEGNREIIGALEGGREDKEIWQRFLRHLKKRGLHGVRLMVGDKCIGLVESIKEIFPECMYQRCMVHFMRNVLCEVPRSRSQQVAQWLKAIFAQEDREASLKKSIEIAEKLMKNATKVLENGITEALIYTYFPHEHWLRIRTNNGIERINREIRRRTNAVGAFPDGNSVLMLVCARLRFVSASAWGVRKYLNMEHLFSKEREATSNSVIS